MPIYKNGSMSPRDGDKVRFNGAATKIETTRSGRVKVLYLNQCVAELSVDTFVKHYNFDTMLMCWLGKLPATLHHEAVGAVTEQA